MPSHHVIYLHGFASSPQSRKAQFFANKLVQEGCSVEIPDLAAGDFEHLTISGQLGITEALLANRSVVLIGSSLGGYVAALCAARHLQVSKVIMLAPAFGFYDLWTAELGYERLEMWRKNGTISVFHYGAGKEMPLAYNLMDDAARFDAFPEFRQPGLIFHGIDDRVVPIGHSRKYVAQHSNIQLLEFRSGHELTDVLDGMWLATRQFLLAD